MENPLYEAILADPEDDTLRLAFADWLEEQPAGERQCPTCWGNGVSGTSCSPDSDGVDTHMEEIPCETCKSSGLIYDTTNANWAEFIRLQVKLHAASLDCGCGGCVDARGGGQHHNGPCGVRREMKAEFDRANQLLIYLPGDVFGYTPWDECRSISDTFHPHANRIDGYDWKIRRGFVDELRIPSSVITGVRCESMGMFHRDRCEGGRVLSPNAQFTQDCRTCNGTGRLRRYAAQLGGLPLTRIVLTDKEPQRDSRGRFVWWNGPLVAPTANMRVDKSPMLSLDLFPGRIYDPNSKYDHLKDALDAVSEKATAFCRAEYLKTKGA